MHVETFGHFETDTAVVVMHAAMWDLCENCVQKFPVHKVVIERQGSTRRQRGSPATLGTRLAPPTAAHRASPRNTHTLSNTHTSPTSTPRSCRDSTHTHTQLPETDKQLKNTTRCNCTYKHIPLSCRRELEFDPDTEQIAAVLLYL